MIFQWKVVLYCCIVVSGGFKMVLNAFMVLFIGLIVIV